MKTEARPTNGEFERGNFVFTCKDGTIVAARTMTATPDAEVKVELCQRVRSSGRGPVAKGHTGVVTKIVPAWEDGRTTDFVLVTWDGNSVPLGTKFRELDLL